MATARARRSAALAVALLGALLVPLTGPAVTADAADTCGTVEPEVDAPPDLTTPSPNPWGCDDTTPPDTAVTSMSPVPTAGGWTREDSVTFEFHEVVADGDPGPWAFACRLEGPGRTAGFQDCTSPTTYTGLTDTGATPYRFSVYAIDAHDTAILFTGTPVDTTDDEPLTDHDDDSQSPATRTWQQDTLAPNTFAFDHFDDALRPDWPMAESPDVPFTLGATPGVVGYRCTLNERAVPCADGRTTLRSLSGGNKTFRATAVDAAGNVDTTPAVARFSVPSDLVATPGWRTVRERGHFAGDFLEARKFGAQVTAPGRNVRELRLIAPRGPGLGRVQVRVGSSPWRTVNLRGATRERFHVYVVRDQYAPMLSGTIRVRVASAGQPVRVDAVLARR